MPRKNTTSDDTSRPLTVVSDSLAPTSPIIPGFNALAFLNMGLAGELPSQAPARVRTQKTSTEKSGRKSAAGQEGDEAGGTEKPKVKKGKSKGDDMTIDDLLLPRSLISRLSRGSLPPNTSLQKDALLALTKSATVFISYLAHTSNSMTSRKTIQATDVLEAIRDMELESVMGGRLEGEIKLFDEGVKGKRKGYRDRVKARESTGGPTTADDGGVTAEKDAGVEDDERGHERKRIRRENNDDNDDGTNRDVDVDVDVDMDRHRGGVTTTKSTSNLRDDNTADHHDDDPSAQLIAEATRAAGVPVRTNKTASAAAADNDRTETDPEEDEEEDDDDEDSEIDDDEEDSEIEDDEDDEDDDEQEELEPESLTLVADESTDMNREEKARRKAGMLAPNGRIEEGIDGDTSDEEEEEEG